MPTKKGGETLRDRRFNITGGPATNKQGMPITGSWTEELHVVEAKKQNPIQKLIADIRIRL